MRQVPLNGKELDHVNRLLIINDRGRAFFGRQRNRNGGDILGPGFNSLSEQMIRFKYDLTMKSNHLFPPSTVGYFAAKNAVPTDFSKLVTVMPGYGMNPLTVPLLNNTLAREEAGLSNEDFTPRERKIFTEVFRLMHAERDFTRSLYLRPEASMMMPTFEKNPIIKKRLVERTIEHVDPILTLLAEDKLEELAQRFMFVIAYATLTRSQADGCKLNEHGIEQTKDREVADLDFALSGGTRGSRRPADKRVFLNSKENPYAQASRERTAFGGSGVANQLLAALYTPLRCYLDRFAFTYKHRSPSEKLAKIKRFRHAIGADVHQHDQLISPAVIDLYCELLYEVFDPRVALMIDMMLHAPTYVPNPDAEVKSTGWWLGNPFNPHDFQARMGLPSGIANNPDIGKWNMTATYLCELDLVTHDVLEEGIGRILKGESTKYGLLDMADDGVILLNQASHAQNLRERWEAMATPEGTRSVKAKFHRIGIEMPVVFLGDVFYVDDRNELCVAPNPVSFFVNFWCPEYPTDMRPYWPVGWDARQAHYTMTPLYGEMYNLQEELFYKHFNQRLDAVVHSAKEQMQRRIIDHQRRFNNKDDLMYLSSVAQLNTADREYLMNPDAIFYKISPEDLSDPVRAGMTKVSGEFIEQHLSNLYY